MEVDIWDNLQQGKTMAIIGPSDSGKTYFIKDTLIPFLEMKGYKVAYFPDGDLIGYQPCDVAIFDEAETLIDQEIIEIKDGKTYSPEYLKKVKTWEGKYKLFNQPSVFVISRNSEDIPYLIKNLKTVGGKSCVNLNFSK